MLLPRHLGTSLRVGCLWGIWALATFAAVGAQARWASPTAGEPGDSALNQQTPRALEGVGVDAKEGAQVPLDRPLRNETGALVTLGQLLQPRRPTILTFNYAGCPMLCSLQLDGLVAGLRGIPSRLGEGFDIITVSMVPDEDVVRNQAFKQKYLAQYAGGDMAASTPAAAAGWHFLTGSAEQVDTWARAVGFKFRYVPERDEYAHTAAVMLLSADGILSRYLYGVQFEPRDLRLALAEASAGHIGSTVDRILLYCFHYDAAAGRYAPVAANIMSLMGLVTLVILGGTLAFFWWRYEKRALMAR